MNEKAQLIDSRENRIYPISSLPLRIGRAADNDIIVADSTVSRHHAEIDKKGEEWVIRDLGSTNGTFVNGRKIKESYLKHNDIITLGKREFIFKLVSSPALLSDSTIVERVEEIFKRKPAVNLNKIINAVASLARMIVEGRSEEEILQTVSKIAKETTGSERAFVVIQRGPGYDVFSTEEEKGEISHSIVNKAIEEKVCIVTQDALADERFRAEDSVLRLGIRSAICVPIWHREKVLGALYLDTSYERSAYRSEDLEFLSMLGNYVAIAIEHKNFMEQISTERKLRERLERYHSPSVVNRIFSQGLESTAIGRKFFHAQGTVLFADIVGFTTLTEEMPPEQVGLLLNEFLSTMTEIVFKYEGTLDKYLGDGLMALFGIPFYQEDHAVRALKAALSMQEMTRQLFGDKIKIRIGVNSGGMIAGDFGSDRRLEFTVIGHTVNLAARLEREVAPPGGIAVGQATKELAEAFFEFEDLGEKKLKGLRSKVKCYLLKGVKQ